MKNQKLKIFTTRRSCVFLSPIIISIFLFLSLSQISCSKKIVKNEGRTWYLIGNVKDAAATIETDKGTQKTTFRGSLVFRASEDTKQGIKLQLENLSLIGKSIQTEKGDSGGISLYVPPMMTAKAYIKYSSEKTRLTSTFPMTLHYSLIDKIKGFRTSKVKEPHDFSPFTETGKGKLSGRFQRPLKLRKQESVRLDSEFRFDLNDPVLGVITVIMVDISWVFTVEPTAWVYRDLCIQPVFIRSGPADPSPTGENFLALMNNSRDIWIKCCRTFTVRDPIYVNDTSYKILDPSSTDGDNSPDEAEALMDEVDPHGTNDCIEVFVASRWDGVEWDGGGATWSSGTAAAKIVTVDQQLDVPCAGTGSCASCGALNQNHLAHELGHVLNLCHPANCPDPARPRGTATTIMEPSGWCADNPDSQSRHNCVSASNPLVEYVLRPERCEGTWEMP